MVLVVGAALGICFGSFPADQQGFKLPRDQTVHMVVREPGGTSLLVLRHDENGILQEVSAEHFTTRQIDALFEGITGDSLEVQIERTLSERRIPLAAEYKVEGLPRGAVVEWDFNHMVDSDNDGIFRNDADAKGPEVRWIYSTNRTPYIVTARITTPDGKEFTWEDTVSFNVQNGDEVLLDASGFLDEGNIAMVRWEVSTGDPRDKNFTISSPTRQQTTLVAEYPEFGHVILRATDMQGNQHEYDTLLYVFNKQPGLFKVRGLRTHFWLTNEDFGYLNLALEYLKDMGFNWIKIPIYWPFKENPDGTYSIYPTGTSPHFGFDELLEEIISVLHEHGFGVELGLEITPPHGTNLDRNSVPMEARFFESPEGYFNYVRHFIDIANRTGVEVFVGKTEMGVTDTYAARPWMDRLIEIMKEGLVSSEYTLENFHYPGRGIPKPWDPYYGTDLNKLNLIEWSAYDKLGSYDDASIPEMTRAFRWNQTRIFSLVHERYPHLRQRIGEFGVPSVDGGAVRFSGAITPSASIDYEEQRRGAAAILKALIDYIKEGNDFFEGLFWLTLTICMEQYRIQIRKDFPIWGKPAMEEFYVFYSSGPKMLTVVPYFHRIYSTRLYINPLQDIHLIRTAHPDIIEGFEGSRNYREYLSAWGLHYEKALVEARPQIVTGESYEGNQSLEVEINTPHGLGANVGISSRFPVGGWENVGAISVAIKRMDPGIGAAIVIPDGEDLTLSYTARLPVSRVGEWEYFTIPLSDFVTLAPDGSYQHIQNTNTLNKWDLYLVLYPITEEPLNTKVYIDSLGVVRGD